MRKNSESIGSVMRHNQIMLLVIGILVVAGIYALAVMPKQEYPTFTIRQGVVVGVYPGANSSVVEQQLTKPLEKYLLTFPEVNRKKTYSHTKDGIVYFYVELADNVKDKDIVWSKIKHSLSVFKSQLPSGVLALIANDNFGDVAAILLAMESEDKTYREMDGYVDVLESRLRQVPSVANVNRHGSQKEQISIYLDNDKLSAYGIGSKTLLLNLLTQGVTTTSGKIDNDQMHVPIHIADPLSSEKEIEEQIIYSDPQGNVIRVKDIGRVVREYPDPESYITHNGKKCVLLSLEVQKSANIVSFGKEVDKVLKNFEEELPESVQMHRIADQPEIVGNSISSFLQELLMAVIAVVLVIMLLLPLRVAAVAATSIPITIFISIAILYAVGIPLNMVTLAALIVVLGMIVDNSVVIVDNYLDKLDHGMSRWHAAIVSAKEYLKSIFSATLAISITFFPFLITMTGTTYDFLEYFPWTVTITLSISLLVAIFVIPFIQYVFIRKGLLATKRERALQGKPERKTILDYLQGGYDKLLTGVFKHPKATIGIAVISVGVGLYLFATLPQRMMPVVERNQFAVEMYLPQGSPLGATGAVSDSMEHLLRRDPRVESVTAFVGASSPRFHLVYAPNMPSPAYAQFIVNTTSAKATEEILTEYTDQYAFYFPEAYIRFKQLDFQAVAAPVEIRFSGENLQELKTQSEKMISYLNTLDECLRVRTDFDDMLPGAEIVLDPVEAGRLGVNKALASLNLSSNYGGMSVSTMWEGDYPLSVVLKSDKDNEGFNSIENVDVSGVIPGSIVPLRQVGTVKPDWTEGQIVRRNGMLTISVLADLKWNVNATEVIKKVRQHVDSEVIPALPKGVNVEYGGETELNNEIIPDMINAMVIAVFIIFLILVFHFKRLKLALLVFSSMALTVFGAAFGVWIMGIDFSVTAMLGLVSLAGIVVRNGIIMFDYTDELRQKYKLPVGKAAFEAGKRRMRPIFLTSAAASMGVLPMVLSGDLMWAPLGTVIFFGTLISMIFVVTVLPVAYWLLYKKSDRKVKVIADRI